MIKQSKWMNPLERWYIEFFSAVILIFLGLSTMCSSTEVLSHDSLWEGFFNFFSCRLWFFLFLGCGGLQWIALLKESLYLRIASAFWASFVFLWGTLNIACYGYEWRLSLLAWMLFAMSNLCVLVQHTSKMEKKYEPL